MYSPQTQDKLTHIVTQLIVLNENGNFTQNQKEKLESALNSLSEILNEENKIKTDWEVRTAIFDKAFAPFKQASEDHPELKTIYNDYLKIKEALDHFAPQYILMFREMTSITTSAGIALNLLMKKEKITCKELLDEAIKSYPFLSLKKNLKDTTTNILQGACNPVPQKANNSYASEYWPYLLKAFMKCCEKRNTTDVSSNTDPNIYFQHKKAELLFSYNDNITALTNRYVDIMNTLNDMYSAIAVLRSKEHRRPRL